MVEKITHILQNEIDRGFVTDIESIFSDIYNILESVNDGFYFDIDIVLNYNCYPVYYIVLSLSYDEDVFESDKRIDYIFNFIENDDNLTITSIEEVNINNF